jgi:hypothetical protein
LGRNGDIINALPLAWEEFRIRGPQDWIVSEEFAPLLEGVSYVRPVIFKGQYWDLQACVQEFSREYDELRIVQAWSANWPTVALGDSFVRSAFAQIGRRGWPGVLCFDRRSPEREARLVERLGVDSNTILLAIDGTSSPFAHRAALLESLKSAFGDRVKVIDPIAERIYDVLGLFDRAVCLVTIDSAFLHLSWATPRLPVIALIADGPTSWHGTATRPNQAFRCRYGEYPARAAELLAAVEQAIQPRPEPKLWHCWSDFKRSQYQHDRHYLASRTWLREYGSVWNNSPFIGGCRHFDARELPLIKDILNNAADKAADTDLLVITNDDVGFAPGLTGTLLDVARWPLAAAYAHRSDTLDENALDGEPYPGVDLFAIGVKLWKQWRNEYPDMVLGAEQWDLVMLAFMRRVGAPALPSAIWHRPHQPAWAGNAAREANAHNRREANRWFDRNNLWADAVIDNLV